jgi:hypothetical protein
MKKTVALAAGLTMGLSWATAQAADTVTIQLKWVAQAQFAGYFVAKEKGFYKDAGLDVTIKAGGPDVAPPQVIAGGGADVIVDWMPSALASREKGVPLVNISQTFKKSGLELTCRAETGIKKPTDFKGKTIGVWYGGNEYPFLSWMSKLGIKTDGSSGGIKVIKQGFNVDPLLQKQADCVSTMTYNEYWQVIDGGYKPSQLVVFKYEDEGLDEGLGLRQEPSRRSREDHPRGRYHRRQDRQGPEADDGRDRQAARLRRRQARRQGLRSHRGDPDVGGIGPRHHQEAGRRLFVGGHRRDEVRGVHQRAAGAVRPLARPTKIAIDSCLVDIQIACRILSKI